MLICKKCNIEYEEGKKYCRNCGSKLLPKDEPPHSFKESNHSKMREPERVNFCPKCNTPYKSGKFCRKCGTQFIQQIEPGEVIGTSQDIKKETPETQIFENVLEKKNQENLFCPNCNAFYSSGKFCRKCGTLLKTIVEELEVESPKPQSFPSDQKPIPHIKVREKEKFKKSEMPLILRKKLFLKPIFIGSAAIIILIIVGGYLLWPKYSYLIRKKTPPIELIQKTEPPTISGVSNSSQKTEKPHIQQSEAETIDSIKNTLETIRQANLQQNIELFMSCYSNEFKDRENRKSNTLENWKHFDYLDLSYNLKNYSISGEIAEARVEWFVLTQPKGSGQSQESKVTLDVTFIKEEGGWKIKEIRPVS